MVARAHAQQQQQQQQQQQLGVQVPQHVMHELLHRQHTQVLQQQQQAIQQHRQQLIQQQHLQAQQQRQRQSQLHSSGAPQHHNSSSSSTPTAADAAATAAGTAAATVDMMLMQNGSVRSASPQRCNSPVAASRGYLNSTTASTTSSIGGLSQNALPPHLPLASPQQQQQQQQRMQSLQRCSSLPHMLPIRMLGAATTPVVLSQPVLSLHAKVASSSQAGGNCSSSVYANSSSRSRTTRSPSPSSAASSQSDAAGICFGLDERQQQQQQQSSPERLRTLHEHDVAGITVTSDAARPLVKAMFPRLVQLYGGGDGFRLDLLEHPCQQWSELQRPGVPDVASLASDLASLNTALSTAVELVVHQRQARTEQQLQQQQQQQQRQRPCESAAAKQLRLSSSSSSTTGAKPAEHRVVSTLIAAACEKIARERALSVSSVSSTGSGSGSGVYMHGHCARDSVGGTSLAGGSDDAVMLDHCDAAVSSSSSNSSDTGSMTRSCDSRRGSSVAVITCDSGVQCDDIPLLQMSVKECFNIATQCELLVDQPVIVKPVMVTRACNTRAVRTATAHSQTDGDDSSSSLQQP
eukprot:17483-Heterococcus_DN1.PRE.1